MDWRHYVEIERGACKKNFKSLTSNFSFKFVTLPACTATLCVAFHDGPVVDILPSPHISNAVLSVGGHVWAIWKSLDLVREFYTLQQWLI